MTFSSRYMIGTHISKGGDIMATSFSGGGSRSTRREPPTIGKQLVNFITYGDKSSAPFLFLCSVL
jgi:hypothetical protein